jgi:hypothetical protein
VRRKEYLTGGMHELELHVDIKIERGGKGKGLFNRSQARIGVACTVDIKIERGGKEKGLFDRRQARIGVACRYKDREREGKKKGKGLFDRQA